MSRISKAWLIAGVAVSPLLLSGCVSKSDYDALASQNQQLQAQSQQLQSQNQQLQAQNQQLQVHVERLQHAITYTVNTDLLFRPGSWKMTSRGKDIISKLSQQLAPTQQDKVMISGYTDNAPIGATLKKGGVTSNQELSQRRAEAVMQYLISQGVRPEMVAAQGFGDSDPVAPNSTAQGRAQNRRVILSVANEAAPAQGSSVPH